MSSIPASFPFPMRKRTVLALGTLGLGALGLFAATYESYTSLYDADYVGSKRCAECHQRVYEQWLGSPHQLMARPATEQSVLGNFSNVEWHLPEQSNPVARMYRENDAYFMALWHPPAARWVPFRVDYVVGYQHRQTYLTREKNGVLRKLPLEWSRTRREFFDYWSFQESRPSSLLDLWHQTQVPNSAWNLFCARCHVTHLEIHDKDDQHTRALTRWSEDGIACEACHGPGSAHAHYFAGNYVNRLAAFLNAKVRGQPVAYIANPRRLTKGQDLSTCARCHGPDIEMQTTEAYRTYEPGYSKSGKLNDLSAHFFEMPLEPNRTYPTVETWADGRPKGIAMLFRSFLEAKCSQKGEARCYDCHDPHANKAPRAPGLLEPSPQSDEYCLRCHEDVRARRDAHTAHRRGSPGSFCYDCHMPKHIMNLADGTRRWTRTHEFSASPRPEASAKHGQQHAPNACTDCHQDKPISWAIEQVRAWK